MKRSRLVGIAAALFISLIASKAFAHCQIPCGIYDDHARVTAMLEDAATVEKSIKLINELAGKSDPQSQNQLVRWVEGGLSACVITRPFC